MIKMPASLKAGLDSGKLIALIGPLVQLIQAILDDDPEVDEDELVRDLDAMFVLSGLAEALDGPVIRLALNLAKWARARKARKSA